MEDKVAIAHAAGTGRPRIGFYIHLTVFVLVNALLVGVNLLTSPEHLWFQWPLIGWGLGILLHIGLLAFLPKTRERQRHIAPELRKKRRSENRSRTN